MRLRQDGTAGGKQHFEAGGEAQRPGVQNGVKRKWDGMKYGSEEGK